MDTHNFLLTLTVILVAAKLGGVVSARVGLPAVFGQLLAGVILGPSLLGLLQPSESLRAAGELGAIVLMFVAGLETDLQQMRRVGVAACVTAVGGVVLPFVVGTAFAQMWGLGLIPSLFIGTLLTATSVSISAQTLQELGTLRSREGTT